MATSLSRKRHRHSESSQTTTGAVMDQLKPQQTPQYAPPQQLQPAKISKKQHVDIIDLDSDSEDYIFKNDKMLRHLNDGVDGDNDNDSAVEFVDSRNIHQNNDDDVLGDNDEETSTSMSYSPDPFQKAKPQPRSRHFSLLLKSVRRKFNNNNLSPGSSNESLPLSAVNSKKKRTRSLPQLPYSTMVYNPYLNRESISMKIGEVKASKILQQQQQQQQHDTPFFDTQHQPQLQQQLNYTYYNNNQNIMNGNRKFSFQQDVTPSYFNNQQDNKSIPPILKEDVQCDDKDGHYNVKINAGFANDRFIVKELLGQGTFGKVVKAWDTFSNEMVAIKIIKSIPKYREASKIELRVLTMLKKHDPMNEFQCIHLRECFDYRDHICIVTDLLRQSLYDFMESTNFAPFPGSHIQAFARQMLRSVAFLHDLNLIHTDLKPENILLIDDVYEHRNGKMVLKDPRIFIIDFGSAIFNDEYHSSVVSTRHYRAPEIILGTGWSFPCDMWSLGCILVELLTGEALFKTHENEQHLAMMEKVLGSSVDINMVSKCLQLYGNGEPRPNSRFDTSVVNAFDHSNLRLKFTTSMNSNNSHYPHINGSKQPSSKLKKEVKALKLIDDLIWDKVGNDKRGDKFWKYFIDLLKRMLIWDPDKRITAREALNHKWFTKGVNDEGIA